MVLCSICSTISDLCLSLFSSSSNWSVMHHTYCTSDHTLSCIDACVFDHWAQPSTAYTSHTHTHTHTPCNFTVVHTYTDMSYALALYTHSTTFAHKHRLMPHVHFHLWHTHTRTHTERESVCVCNCICSHTAAWYAWTHTHSSTCAYLCKKQEAGCKTTFETPNVTCIQSR